VRRLAVVAIGALALLAPAAAAAFVPNDPFAGRQWYLDADHAFDAWPVFPALAPVRVAVIDSGVDAGHPELQGRIVAARSFVGGSVADRQGHGTFIAGMIAASANNAVGIAGLGLPVELVVARIVTADGRIPIDAEAAAIRWAADQGARVINLSIGGLRDPRDPGRDTYSAAEAAAVRYAWSRGAVLVAAVGNADQAPTERWPFASYPAALPHVIGVSAYGRDGSVPPFSNRDALYNDLAAPGQDMFSLFPRPLTAQRPACAEQGYSTCASAEYRDAEGTSFAAPQVAAAAALLLATRPDLRPDQVASILERSADDANATNGCRACALRRDALTGWGRLDVARAVAALGGPLRAPDRYEPNDDAGRQAVTLSSRTKLIRATLDFWDDPRDVYRVRVSAGQRLRLRATGPTGTDTDLALWKPGTRRLDGVRARARRAAQSVRPGASEQIVYRARRGGWYYVELSVVRGGSGTYTLALSRTR
jgi:subtilisin family serine protease